MKIKKWVLSLLLIVSLIIPQLTQAETLKGNVEKVWTLESARTEAFKQAQPWINLDEYPSMDPNLVENKNLIEQNQFNSNGRKINSFSDGWYSVKYDNAITQTYYYNQNGEFQEIDFQIYAKNICTKDDFEKYSEDELFPAKRYKHAYPSGKIISVSMDTNIAETYEFKLSGELNAHWIGANGYDANGNIFITRAVGNKEDKQ